jgi:ferredoxin
MTVTVTEGCIGCGVCAEEAPDLFQLNEQGVAQGVGQVPAGEEATASQAAADCPVGVIQVT